MGKISDAFPHFTPGEDPEWEKYCKNQIMVEEDDDEYDDGLHEMTWEERRAYSAQVQASDGFDVEGFPNVFSCGMIQPVILNDHELKELNPYSELAIKHYNDKENTKFEFVKVVKANSQPVRGILYYITFVAKDSVSAKVETFQARVLFGIPEPGEPREEVEMCRIKTDSPIDPPPTRDPKVAVDMLNRCSNDFHPHAALIEDCKLLMRSVPDCKVVHTLREGNFCADFMANLGTSLTHGVHVFDSLTPLGICSSLMADVSLSTSY